MTKKKMCINLKLNPAQTVLACPNLGGEEGIKINVQGKKKKEWTNLDL